MILRDDGFFLSVQNLFGQYEHDLVWSDLREVRLVKGGYGMRNMDFLVTHEAAERLGLVRTTTRKSSPDLLVGRKISLPLPLLELSGQQLIERLTKAADKAGYVVTRKGLREFLVLSFEIFEVAPKPQ